MAKRSKADSAKVEAAKKAKAKRAKARRHLIDFVKYTKPDYNAGWFSQEVCAKLEWFYAEVKAKRSPRLMIFSHPRSGKSEIVSRRAPAWFEGKDPDLSIIATSYGADLASRMNRDVQRIIDSDRYRLVFKNTTLYGRNVRSSAQGKALRNNDIFEIVGHQGVYRSAGVGGGITGMGADVLIIDDVCKDKKEADSKTYRDNVWEWYTSTAYTRLSTGGGVLIIMTRWHQDDLAGRLLTKMADDTGDDWEVMSFPAIAETNEKHRKTGEALDPARFPLEQLAKIKKAVGTRVWEALYQQHPAALEGNIFRREWWRFWRYSWEPAIPDLENRTVIIPDDLDTWCSSWDCAFKKLSDSDRVAGGVWAVKGANKYLCDMYWDRMTFTETVKALKEQRKDWPQVQAWIVEDKANGTAVIDTLKSDIPGLIAIEPHGGKEARASATSPQVEAGNIYLRLHARWRDEYIEEHANFPEATHDDAVDQQSQVLIWLASKDDAIARLRMLTSGR